MLCQAQRRVIIQPKLMGYSLFFEKYLTRDSKLNLKTGTLAWHYMCFGGWERGKKILDEVIRHNYKYPIYFHAATLLYFYRKEEYEKAFLESNEFNLPELFWSSMLRIAVLGQLGRIEEARSGIDLLIQLKPDFEETAAYLISRFVKEEELVENVMEGIRKAGLKV